MRRSLMIVWTIVALLLSRALTGWRPLAIAIYASLTTMGAQLAACIDAWSAVSDTLADLGWLLFASCILAILMADLGNGHPERRAATSG